MRRCGALSLVRAEAEEGSMEAQCFSDSYRPIGGRFYAKRWSGTSWDWIIYGVDKHGHYSVGLDLSWFYAKLYVDRLNRIIKLETS